MPTPTKSDRPQILTESDKILSELTDELADLKIRMRQIEVEQTENRNLIQELGCFEEIAQNSQVRLIEERGHHRENYQVIANVMQNLKSPVNNVMDNLAGLIANIPDEETKESLRDCMDTASSVLESFTEVEEFCKSESADGESNQEVLDLREFFKDFFTQLQADSSQALNQKLKLMVESEVPIENALYPVSLKSILRDLLIELDGLLPQGEIQISVRTKEGGEKFGVSLKDLEVSIEGNQATELVWNDNWVESIHQNAGILQKGGLNLLQSRNLIRDLGGSLDFTQKDKRITGFSFLIPLTY